MRLKPKSGWRNYLKRHGLMSLAFYIFVCGGLYVFQDRFVYPGAYFEPYEGYDQSPFDSILKSEKVPVSGGEIYVRYTPPAAGKPTVIFFHGNGTYPESYLELQDALLRRGIGIVMPAMRGYPRSFGTPGEEAIHSDARKLFDWASSKYPRSKIVVGGHSLGTGVAIPLATERDVAGVFLLSPYLSMRSLAQRRLPFIPMGLLLTSPFRSDLAMSKVDAPILAFHGQEDNLIPISSGRALMDLAKHSATFTPVAGAGHNTGMFEDDTVEAIGEFVETVGR